MIFKLVKNDIKIKFIHKNFQVFYNGIYQMIGKLGDFYFLSSMNFFQYIYIIIIKVLIFFFSTNSNEI